MQRTYRRLTAARVAKLAAARTPGKFPDGDGLSLVIAKSGAASWVYRYMLAGRNREMGLGPARDVSLKEAREAALEARGLKRSGVDPLAARQARRQGEAVARARSMTFAQCAKAYITAHQKGWGTQHVRQSTAAFETYVFPLIGDLPVEVIDTALVLKVLQPLWQTVTTTAAKVRGQIESVLDWATVSELRRGANPARWKGHLEHKLAKRSLVAPVKHHPALPYQEIAGFIARLRVHDDQDLRALELAILCAARSGEVLGARWPEFNQPERLWVIPPERMKAGKEHRVPLRLAPFRLTPLKWVPSRLAALRLVGVNILPE